MQRRLRFESERDVRKRDERASEREREDDLAMRERERMMMDVCGG